MSRPETLTEEEITEALRPSGNVDVVHSQPVEDVENSPQVLHRLRYVRDEGARLSLWANPRTRPS